MLNSKQILEEGLLKLENSKGKPAQIGYDLSIKNIKKIGPCSHTDPKTLKRVEGKIGMILKDKTLLTDYEDIFLTTVDGYEGWLLYPGVYDLTFWEGCDIPDNRAAFIKQRSSLKRNGSSISSPVFDPGFTTENIGTVMSVEETIFLEKDARLAQIYFHECEPVGELYNGAWQNDKQRINHP